MRAYASGSARICSCATAGFKGGHALMRRINMDNNNVALITKMVLEAVEKQKSSEKEPGYLVPVGVSARHIHLTQEHVEALFGPGYQLTKKKELMGGQFASNETVTIVGLKLRAIENVRTPPIPIEKPMLRKSLAASLLYE